MVIICWSFFRKTPLPLCCFVTSLLTVLEEVKDTYRDVRRLEASILELHKMFMDLALLVDRQGEMLDQIEYQVRFIFFLLHGLSQSFLIVSCETVFFPLLYDFFQAFLTFRLRKHIAYP